MAKRVGLRRHRHIRLVLTVGIGLLFAIGSGQAHAENIPNSTIEQHWEVISESGSYSGSAATALHAFARFELPGGTTKLEPAPTATFEMVSRLTGATGTAGWRVELADYPGNNNIATIDLRANTSGASSFALRTASITWSSQDRLINFVRISPLSGGPTDLPGAFEWRKGYIKLKQSGTVKKTIGRVHMAAYQRTGITTSWADIADPVIFQMPTNAYSPSPTIRFSAQGSEANARLWDIDADAPVSGSTVTFGNPNIYPSVSGPISLVGGRKYKVQVQQVAGALPNNIMLEAADLVFEQETPSIYGLTKTIGYYTGVSSPQDWATSSQTYLDAPFNAPNISSASTIYNWFVTTKRLGYEAPGIRVMNRTAQSPLTNTGWIASTSYQLSEISNTATPAVGDDVDLISVVTNPASTGRIASSLLRILIELRDSTPPTISGFSVSRSAFSPNNDAWKDNTTLSATIIETQSLPVTWQIVIANGAGSTVKTFTGSGLTPSATWDGKNSSGVVVPDGGYTATLTATDDSGNVSTPATTVLTVDTVAGDILSYDFSPTRFSPGNRDGYLDSTQGTATFSESSPWTFTIRGPGNLLLTAKSSSGSGSSISENWDGRGTSWGGATVDDGDYTATLTIEDAAGNRRTATRTITVDSSGPTISGYQASPASFSPNADGTQESATLSVTSLNDVWTPIEWTISIKNSAGAEVKNFAGTGTTFSQVWDGKDQTTGVVVPDGTYSALLTVKDAGRNSRTSTYSIKVDTVAPLIKELLPTDRGNTVYTAQRLGGKFADALSGVDSSTISVTFGGTTYSSGNIVYNSSTGWATSPQVSLTPGSNYTASVQFRDRAGNLTSKTWLFRAIQQPSADTALASLSGSGQDVGSGATPGNRLWRFRPSLSVGTRRVHFDQGSKHPGFGAIQSSVPLASAEIQVTIGSVKSTWPVKPYAASTTKTVYHQLPYVNPNGAAETVLVPGGSYELPTFDFELPSAVTVASLNMSEIATTAQTSALCENPTANANCRPDPLRFFVSDDLADKLFNGGKETQTAFPEATWESERPFVLGIDKLVLDTTNTTSGAWRTIQPLQSFPCIPGANPTASPVCLVEDVYYPVSSTVIPPSLYDTVCETIRFCIQFTSQADAIDENGFYEKYYCIRASDGADEQPAIQGNRYYGAYNENCQQEWGMTTWQPYVTTGNSGDKIHLFQTYWASDWGYNDSTYDRLGVHWATKMKDMEWGYPRASDKPAGLTGSWDEVSYDVGIYPETAPYQPTSAAYDSYINCFAIPGKNRVDAVIRSMDQSDGTIHKGSGAGAEFGSAGYRQYQSCGSPTVYLRTEYATLYAFVVQMRTCGAACGTRQDGFLKGSWGHTYKTFNPSAFIWHFLKGSAMSCAEGASCVNPLGILFVTSDSEDAATDEKQKVQHVDNPRSFRYD